MPNVTGSSKSFGGSASAGRSASNSGTGRTGAERGRKADLERKAGFKTVGVGPAGGPVFESTTGLSTGIQATPTADKMKANQERGAIYNSAAGKWNKSAAQPSLANLANNMAPLGLSMQPPDLSSPATFAGGDYHLGWNPGSLAGLAGLALPGLGFATSPLGQAAYTAMGGQNIMLGGQGAEGMQKWEAPGLNGGTSFGSSMAPQASGMGGMRTENGGLNLSALLQQQRQRPRLGQMMIGR